MKRRTPSASAAIVTGIGMIAFAIYYNAMGIFPTKTRWSPPLRSVVRKEEPARFRGLVLFTVLTGGGILAWGLTRWRKG